MKHEISPLKVTIFGLVMNFDTQVVLDAFPKRQKILKRYYCSNILN